MSRSSVYSKHYHISNPAKNNNSSISGLFAVSSFIVFCLILSFNVNTAEAAIPSGEGRWDFSFVGDSSISEMPFNSTTSDAAKLLVNSVILFHGYSQSGTADVLLSVTNPEGIQKQYLQRLNDMKPDETKNLLFIHALDVAGKYKIELEIIPPDGISNHVFDRMVIYYDHGIIDSNISNMVINLEKGKSKIVKIFGKVSEHFAINRFPIHTTMISPDGTVEHLKTRTTSTGYFEVPILFDEKSKSGTYQFVIKYLDYQSQTIQLWINSLYS